MSMAPYFSFQVHNSRNFDSQMPLSGDQIKKIRYPVSAQPSHCGLFNNTDKFLKNLHVMKIFFHFIMEFPRIEDVVMVLALRHEQHEHYSECNVLF